MGIGWFCGYGGAAAVNGIRNNGLGSKAGGKAGLGRLAGGQAVVAGPLIARRKPVHVADRAARAVMLAEGDRAV